MCLHKPVKLVTREQGCSTNKKGVEKKNASKIANLK